MSDPATALREAEAPKSKRDWFGYVLTAVIGIVATFLATWYQIAVTEREATAAEIERGRAVRQSVIGIIEEQALNGIKLDADRIGRLIDQRRRDQRVLLQIPTVDVVEQAEFNIASSPYLPVSRKEEIKPIFESLYADVASRSFLSFPDTEPNSELLNELAKQIQEGKSSAALANLKRLQEIHSATLVLMAKRSRVGFFDAFLKFFTEPSNLAVFLGLYFVVLQLALRIRKWRMERWGNHRNWISVDTHGIL